MRTLEEISWPGLANLPENHQCHLTSQATMCRSRSPLHRRQYVRVLEARGWFAAVRTPTVTGDTMIVPPLVYGDPSLPHQAHQVSRSRQVFLWPAPDLLIVLSGGPYAGACRKRACDAGGTT